MDGITAPGHWRCIDVLSDLHLHDGLTLTFEVFQRHLAQTHADAVLILGDLFEAWVGDDMRTAPFERQCTQVLAETGQRLYLGIMVGNRDFLLGQDMLTACHAHALPDPCVLHAFGRRHLLTHGDAWCLNDPAYLAFRAQARDPGWMQNFLSQPLPQRLAVARQMRAESQAGQQTMWQHADVDPELAGCMLATYQCDDLVHGHTHRPGSQPFTPAGQWRHVLSDWDLDVEPARAQVLRLTAEGFERVDLTG